MQFETASGRDPVTAVRSSVLPSTCVGKKSFQKTQELVKTLLHILLYRENLDLKMNWHGT